MPRMPRLVVALGLVACLGLPVAGRPVDQLPVATTQAHDKAYWRAIVDAGYAPPEGADVPALVGELSRALASPDPELRDDIGYGVLTNWIYRRRIVPADLRLALAREWVGNLRAGVGERGGDGIFRRSFSALALALLAGTDNEDPFFSRQDFRTVLTAGLTYLRAEQDVRGFDPDKGWMHSVAHTADLLKFLGRSRHLAPGEQAEILTGIADKLDAVDEVLTHGEDERLARAVVSLAARPDFDVEAFRAWSAGLLAAAPAGPPTPASLARARNRRNLMVSLHAVLSTDPRDLASIGTARGIVLDALKRVM
ncbi:MAG: DUF2785 domain-containing protein [Vicinamibacterales bacterium]